MLVNLGFPGISQTLRSRETYSFIVIKYSDIRLESKFCSDWKKYDEISPFNIQGEITAVSQSHNL